MRRDYNAAPSGVSDARIAAELSSQSEPGTVKFALTLRSDGAYVEAVVFAKDGTSVCLSTQVGCHVGCVFCESGRTSFVRNLTAQEIIAQLEAVQARLNEGNREITYAMLQGVGEPLLNYENVVEAIGQLQHSTRWKALRHCISTVGIPDRIRSLSSEGLPINLNVSLHATTDEQRATLMPRTRFTIREILSAVEHYAKHGICDAPIGVQYLLLKGVNDSTADLDRLIEYFWSGPYIIVLKKLCPVSQQPYCAADETVFAQFTEKLDAAGVTTVVSMSRGRSILAGCGQLRAFLDNTSQKGTLSPKRWRKHATRERG